MIVLKSLPPIYILFKRFFFFYIYFLFIILILINPQYVASYPLVILRSLPMSIRDTLSVFKNI